MVRIIRTQLLESAHTTDRHTEIPKTHSKQINLKAAFFHHNFFCIFYKNSHLLYY